MGAAETEMRAVLCVALSLGVAVRAQFGDGGSLPWTTDHYIGGEPFSSSAFTIDGRPADADTLQIRRDKLNERLIGLGPENLKVLKSLREDGLRVTPHWIDFTGVYEKRKQKWSNVRDRGSPPVHPAALDPGVKLLANLTMSGSDDGDCMMEVFRKDCSALYHVKAPPRQDSKTMFGAKKKKTMPGRSRSNSNAKRFEKNFLTPLRENGFTQIHNVFGSLPDEELKDTLKNLLNDDSNSREVSPGVRMAYQPFELHKNLTAVVCNDSISERFKSYSVNQAQMTSASVYHLDAGVALADGKWTGGGWGGYRLQLLVPLDTTDPIVAVAKGTHRAHMLHSGVVQWEDEEIRKDLNEINELAADLGGGVVIHSNMIHRYIPVNKPTTIAVFEYGEMKRKFKTLQAQGCLPQDMHLEMINLAEQVQEFCPDWYIQVTRDALAMIGITGLSGQQYGLFMATALIGVVFVLVFFFVDPASASERQRAAKRGSAYPRRTGFSKHNSLNRSVMPSRKTQ